MAEQGCREKIMSQEFWDFLIPNYRENRIGPLDENSYCLQEGDFGYQVLYIGREGRSPLSFYEYGYYSIPSCYTPLDMDAVNAAGISAVQNFPALQVMGEGVMIGFVDTGIDYRNPVFQRLDGTTRIAGIWDQTLQQGRTPKGFDYGSEYGESQINEALRSENPLGIVPSVDEEGHGTFLASVAAGSAMPEQRFIGAAPEAEIGVVKLKPAKDYLKSFYAIRADAPCYQENDIILGLAYLNRLAEKRGMPLVVCIAMGTNMGGHNGSSLLSAVLDEYAYTTDRAVVIGTGNEAANRHHFFHRFLDDQETVPAEIRVGAGVTGFSAEIWAKLPDVVTVLVVSPSGERTRPISLRQGQKYDLFFTFDGTDVSIEYRLLLENNDSQLIFLRFQDPAEGIWRLEILSVQRAVGEVHIWLPVQEFLSGEVFFLEADADTTLTEPGSARAAMTVAYYNGKDNGVDIHSGRGYTRSEIIKPDYAAPGAEVTGAGAGGDFVSRTSSSAAAGIAAGASALLMEWLKTQPDIDGVNSIQIRNTIVLGAGQRDSMEYPNREWGYGTLNVYQSLDQLRQL
nr:S8 family peptidase [uncultured Merdimonas sp.]